jgi:non-lysosomal glucosylceramidase
MMYRQRSYSGAATEAAFLLGGIGTGNVSIGSRGELRDWEIFNKPNKGFRLPNTFFAIWAKEEGNLPIAKVLESRLNPPHHLSHGYNPSLNAGLPRLDKSTLYGEYPVANIHFEDSDLPVDVSLEAYTPLIPLNQDDSGIPGAIFTYRVKNNTTQKWMAASLNLPIKAGWR